MVAMYEFEKWCKQSEITADVFEIMGKVAIAWSKGKN
jgi:hypothetical protein